MIKVISIVSLFTILYAGGSNSLNANGGDKSKVNWLKPSELQPLLENRSLPILVDVYTDWCHYCKVMDNTTWSHDSVVNYVTTHFYPVKLNAESQRTEKWLGKEYGYQVRYKLNSLAIELLRGQMVYPSTVIIPQKGEPQIIPGAIKPSEIELLLKYYGSGANENEEFETYMRKFSSLWQ